MFQQHQHRHIVCPDGHIRGGPNGRQVTTALFWGPSTVSTSSSTNGKWHSFDLAGLVGPVSLSHLSRLPTTIQWNTMENYSGTCPKYKQWHSILLGFQIQNLQPFHVHFVAICRHEGEWYEWGKKCAIRYWMYWMGLLCPASAALCQLGNEFSETLAEAIQQPAPAHDPSLLVSLAWTFLPAPSSTPVSKRSPLNVVGLNSIVCQTPPLSG